MVFVYEFSLDRIKSEENLNTVFVQKINVSDGLADDFSMQIFWLLSR